MLHFADTGSMATSNDDGSSPPEPPLPERPRPNIGQRIYRLIYEQKEIPARIAKMAGMSHSFLSQMINDNRQAGLSTYRELADVLEVDTGALVADSDDVFELARTHEHVPPSALISEDFEVTGIGFEAYGVPAPPRGIPYPWRAYDAAVPLRPWPNILAVMAITEPIEVRHGSQLLDLLRPSERLCFRPASPGLEPGVFVLGFTKQRGIFVAMAHDLGTTRVLLPLGPKHHGVVYTLVEGSEVELIGQCWFRSLEVVRPWRPEDYMPTPAELEAADRERVVYGAGAGTDDDDKPF